MNRVALVIGINTYFYTQDLTAPSRDAEAITKMISIEHGWGGFQITQMIASSPEHQITLLALEQAIHTLFYPESEHPPETALLYFSGHGLRRPWGKNYKGYLAHSGTNPQHGDWGFALDDLRLLLRDSPIREQIIWLDCCHSGELLGATEPQQSRQEPLQTQPEPLISEEILSEADPGNQEGYSRCIITASRDFQLAYEEGRYSLLTRVLLEGLDPNKRSDGWVTNYTLAEFIKPRLLKTWQYPLFHNTGSPIRLTSATLRAPVDLAISGVCPYRALEAFQKQDADFFWGRTVLTDQLLAHVADYSFLAVLGASGSGKSSVIRAGLLYQLQDVGQRLAGSHAWHYLGLMTPGEYPLQMLKMLLGAEADLAQVVSDSQAARVVLVIDQFEECFTLCQGSEEKETERQQFFQQLLMALPASSGQPKGKLCLIVGMRADFLGKCIEYPTLAQWIADNTVMVTPMKERELEEAIAEPAKKVGLEVEPRLVTQMINDVKESPGSLPLLQYALTQLWHCCHSQQCLDLRTYENPKQVGRVQGVLSRIAEETYNEFNKAEKLVAERVFLELTQLGEGTEDTRRPILKQQLSAENQSQVLVNQVLEKLVKARLVVVDQQPSAPQSDVIDLSHEVLIQHWPRLQKLVEDNRDELRRRRRLEQAAREWNRQERQKDFLWSGEQLKEAEIYERDYGSLKRLDPITREFIETSQKRRSLQRKLITRAISSGLILTSAFVGAFLWQGVRVAIEETDNALQSLSSQSERLLDLNQGLDALIKALEAGKRLNESSFTNVNTRFQVARSLQSIISQVRERNRWQGHNDLITQVKFFPNAQLIVSASEAGEIKIWNRDGALAHSMNHSNQVWSLAINPEKQFIAAGDYDGLIKFWSFEGELIHSFEAHDDVIWSLEFSPDRNLLASTDRAGTIKLWDLNGKLITTIESEGAVADVSFNPDGKTFVTCEMYLPTQESIEEDIREAVFGALGLGIFRDSEILDSGGKIKLWDLNGNLLESVRTQEMPGRVRFSPNGQVIVTGYARGQIEFRNLSGKLLDTWEHPSLIGVNASLITSIVFSPDGVYVATASQGGTIRIWDQSGRLLQEFYGHTGQVLDLDFSPAGTELISSGSDKTLRIWSFDNPVNSILQEHETGVDQIRFSPDSTRIATGSREPAIRLWTNDGVLIQLLQKRELTRSERDLLDARRQAYGQYIPPNNLAVNFSSDSELVAVSNGKDIQVITSQGELVTTFKGSSPSAQAGVAFSSNSKLLVWASNDYTEEEYTVRIWNTNGKEIAVLSGHTDVIQDISLSQDGKIIATADRNSVRLWQVDGRLLQRIPMESSAITSIKFSPDSKSIVISTGDGELQILDLVGNPQITIQNDSDSSVSDFDLDPDGKLIAVAREDGQVALWDMNGQEINILQGHSDSVKSVRFSPNGKLIASASQDNTIRIWELNGTEVAVIPAHEEDIDSVNFSPNSRLLVSASEDGMAKVWNMEGELKTTIKFGSIVGGYAAFSPNGRMIVTVGNTVNLWKINGKRIHELNGHTRDLQQLVFVDHSQTLMSTDSFSIKFWNIAGTLVDTLQLFHPGDDDTNSSFDPLPTTSDLKNNLHADNISDIAISQNAKVIASASADNTVKLWKRNGSLIATLAHDDQVLSVAFSPDGKLLVSGGLDKSLRLWNQHGEYLGLVGIHESPIISITFSPDGQIITSADAGGKVSFWDTDDRALLETLRFSQGVDAVNFSPNNDVLAIATGNIVSLLPLNIDTLLTYGCYWVKDYLRNPQADLSRKERRLCEGVQTLIPQGELLARQGKVEAAIEIFDMVAKQHSVLDSSRNWGRSAAPPRFYLDFRRGLSDIDPEQKVQWLAASSLLDQGMDLAKDGEINQAIQNYQNAQVWNSTLRISALHWNSICWYGSLYGYAEQVIDYCEQAVSLDPQNGSWRDSRGVARAITGDLEGAIYDFEYYIDSIENQTNEGLIDYEKFKQQREGWIESLVEGNNPFSPEELQRLRLE
jgi:WD40 repeat protein